MDKDLIISMFHYFSRFVPLNVLREMLIQPDVSRLSGYSEVETEVLRDTPTLTLTVRIPEIKKFICSINENFVSERIKNSNGFILVIEYRNITVDFEKLNGFRQLLAVTVAHNFSDANYDNLNELLSMSRCLDLLLFILRQMKADQSQIDFCSDIQLLTMPVNIIPVDPVSLYGFGGWSALFHQTKTIL
jgi:hypothetical protein